MAASNVARTTKAKPQRNRVLTKSKPPKDRPAWAKDLDDREFCWLSAYLIDFNSTRAALACGFPRGGCSAAQRGYEIKHREHVRTALAAAMRERVPVIKLTLAERLAAIVTTDIGDVVDWGHRRIQINEGETYTDGPKKGQLKPPRYAAALDLKVKDLATLTPRHRAAIKAVKKRIGQYGTALEVQMHDPIVAAEKLANLLGLNDQQTAVGGAVTFVIEAPDGAQIRDISPDRPAIDHDAVARGMAENRDAEPEEVPPGGRLVIEAP